MKGLIVLRESIISYYGQIFPANVQLQAEIDNKDRIFVEHPQDKSLRILIEEKNIISKHWFT